MVARVLLYAGWGVGMVGLLLLSVSDEQWGILALPAGVLLIAASVANIAGALSFKGNRTFLNAVLAVIGLIWMVFGVAVALG